MVKLKDLRNEFECVTLELSIIEDILSTAQQGSLMDCLNSWLTVLCGTLGFDFAQAWALDQSTGGLYCLREVVYQEEAAPQLRKASLKMTLKPGSGLAGKAFKIERLLFYGDQSQTSRMFKALGSQAASVKSSGMKTVCLMPIKVSKDCAYILEFYSQDCFEVNALKDELLERLANLLKNLLKARDQNLDWLGDDNEYKILLDAVPAMVWYKDTQNKILAINKYAADVTGLLPEEIVGRQTEEVYPIDAAKYYQDDLEVMKSARPKRKIIEKVRGKNNENYWVSTDKVPYIKNGKVVGIIVFSTDVSELKHAEEELLKIKNELESKVEERTRELAEANVFFTLSRDLFCIADTKGFFTRLNPVWSERLGYSVEELLTRPYLDFIHEDDRQATLDVAEQLVATGHLRDFENRYVTKDGRIRWFRWSATTFGESIYAVAYDVTDRKVAEQELIDISDRFTQIGKHLPGVIYQFLITGQSVISFPYVSEGCRELFGYEAHEIEQDGMLLMNCVHPDDRMALQAAIDEAATSLSEFRHECRVISRDGRTRYIRANSTPEALDSGDILFNGLIIDLSDLKQAQDEVRKLNQDLEERVKTLKTVNEELELMTKKLEQAYDHALEASELKSEFVANISHEIRTPLSAVIGMSDLLLGTELTSEQTEFASTARDSARALLTIINDILDFSKIEAGKIELEDIAFELQPVIEGSIDFFVKDVAAKGLSILTHVDPSLPRIFCGDPVRIRQILINLVSNAIKFTDIGEVVVRVLRDDSPLFVPVDETNAQAEKRQADEERNGSDGDETDQELEEADQAHDTEEQERHRPIDALANRIRFEVSDTGIGIPEDVRGRLFTPFVQADGSTTRRYGGTGLGLSICKRLVELMGGQIGMESEDNVGSLFWFTIPLEPRLSMLDAPLLVSQPSMDCSNMQEDSDADAQNAVVMLFSDSASTKEIVTSYAEVEGFNVRTATNIGGVLYGLDCAFADGAGSVTLLLDLSRSESDALSLIDAVRRDARYKQVNIVLLADISQRDAAERGCERGADINIFKPFRRVQLISALALRRKDARLASFVGMSKEAQKLLGKRRPREPICVLVVEDNALMRGLTVKQLEKLGIETDTAISGIEALEKTLARDYSLILMDCQMPQMDGFEATLEIRKEESIKGGHVPIVAMTAFARLGDREQCLASGMDDYLSKPVTIDQLETILEKWLPQSFLPPTDKEPSAEPIVSLSETKAENARAQNERMKVPIVLSPSVLSSGGRLPGAPQEAPIDIYKVIHYYGEESLYEILSSFSDELTALMNAISCEVNQGHTEQVEHLAHQLKGLLAVLTAHELCDNAVRLEQACRDNKSSQIVEETERLIHSKDMLVNFINNFLTGD